MGCPIVWTEQAIADLEAIVTHLSRTSPDAARRIGDPILAYVEILANFPFIGPAYPPGSRGPNREIAHRSYRIFYRVIEDPRRVELLAIRHGARDEPELLS